MRSSVFFVFVLCSQCGICRSSSQPNKNATPKASPPQLTNSIKYYEKPNYITIPLMIHLDKALTRGLKHKKTIKKYFKDVLNKVESVYAHPSLNQTVHFNLLDVKMLRNATKKFQMNENISSYLKSYCQWQGEKKAEKKRWYYSVLFTGLNLYSFEGKRKVKISAGRSYMRGVCSSRNSCSLLEWDSKNIAYLLAHELAHSLGIFHDGPPDNHCHGRHIMAARYNYHSPATTWSACNKQDLKKFLASKKAWCLQSNSGYKPYK